MQKSSLWLFVGLYVISLSSFRHSFKNSLSSLKYSRKFLRLSVLDNSVDITGDSGVLKRLIRRGNASKGYPLPNDRVDIAWKIYTFNHQFEKVLAHDSRKSLSLESDGVILDENRAENDKLFQFRIAGDTASSQREVIQGWDIGVRSMFEGEISSFTLSSKVSSFICIHDIVPSHYSLVCVW